METFESWNRKFTNQELIDFTFDESGIVWLKLKSLIRKEILNELSSKNNIALPSKTNDAFKYLYNLYCKQKISEKEINKFILSYNKNELTLMKNNFNKIMIDLYKVKDFSWGGDAKNSLDKQIIRYVKETSSYEKMITIIEKEISINTYNYTISSWYNNWSAILTEYLFKKHSRVLSAVGKIKSVDFFIDNLPIDLKITYFPKAYLIKKRKEYKYPVEITDLKKIARKFKIKITGDETKEMLDYILYEFAKNSKDQELMEKIDIIKKQNKKIIEDSINNKSDLIKWLYENQGEQRFGSENRLYLVLIDANNIDNSWKLKRDFNLLSDNIKNYLDEVDVDKLKKQIVEFTFSSKKYRAIADIIFIVAK